jgi:hypothetical protein
VRIVRPSFFRSEETGQLAPDVRDLLFGLATAADDEGWIIWRPAELAATLYAYTSPRRRVVELQRRAATLIARGFIVMHDCGCAHLPTLKAHHAVKGGQPNASIWSWHQRHVAESVALRSDTEQSVSSSPSSSSSSSDRASSSSGAREDGPAEEAGPSCPECSRPTAIHASTCSRAPHLKVVNG